MSLLGADFRKVRLQAAHPNHSLQKARDPEGRGEAPRRRAPGASSLGDRANGLVMQAGAGVQWPLTFEGTPEQLWQLG